MSLTTSQLKEQIKIQKIQIDQLREQLSEAHAKINAFNSILKEFDRG